MTIKSHLFKKNWHVFAFPVSKTQFYLKNVYGFIRVRRQRSNVYYVLKFWSLVQSVNSLTCAFCYWRQNSKLSVKHKHIGTFLPFSHLFEAKKGKNCVFTSNLETDPNYFYFQFIYTGENQVLFTIRTKF